MAAVPLPAAKPAATQSAAEPAATKPAAKPKTAEELNKLRLYGGLLGFNIPVIATVGAWYLLLGQPGLGGIITAVVIGTLGATLG